MKKLFVFLFVLTFVFTLAACDTDEPGVDASVTEAIEAIEALPEVDALTLTDEAAVVAARALYDALETSLQSEVTNLSTLVALEAKIVELKEAAAGPGTLVDEAVDAGFDTLAAALTEADLVSALSGSDNYTVFAPTEAAFGNLLTALDTDAAGLLAHPFLSEILGCTTYLNI